MTASVPMTPPSALILCTDPYLSRLVEIELSYLGVSAQVEGIIPKSCQELCLLVADGDEFPLTDCQAVALAGGCPLLVFGREEISLPTEVGAFLRRPFGLDRLAEAVRTLLSPATMSLWAGEPAPLSVPPCPAPTAPVPALTVQDGVVTVAGKIIPMTPAEGDILTCLYARRGEVVTREELSTLLGGGGNIVDVYVCRLRSKIEKPLGRRIIWTVRGIGYVIKPEN